MNVAECVACGCDDERACIGGCSWLRVNREAGIGVCSNCPQHVEPWDASEYDMHGDQEIDEERSGLLLPEDPEFDQTLHALRSR